MRAFSRPVSNPEFALRRLGDAAKNLQKSCLAGAVASDDPDALALLHREIDVVEHPFLSVELLPQAKQDLLELIILMRIELKRLADSSAADCRLR
jgi:hypothetical protein